MSVCLHARSAHSLGHGVLAPEELVEGAARAGYQALALTDLEDLHAAPRFQALCRARGIAPLTGVELRRGFAGRRDPGARAGRLVLLARDGRGWSSLCRIVSERRGGAQSAPGGDPLASLARHPAGLLACAGDAATLARLLEEAPLPRESIGALLVQPSGDAGEERALVEIARRAGIPLLAGGEVVLLQPEQRALLRLRAALAAPARAGAAGTRAAREPELESARVLRPARELAAHFADRPEALENARDFAARCTLDLRAHAPHPPDVGPDPGERLARLARGALAAGRARGRWTGAAHAERLESELATVRSMRLAPYLLLVAEVVELARDLGVPLVGRGSAAGSLLCHVLGATAVDPLAHGLLFERFLHARRADLPDVDLDLGSRRRGEVLEALLARFGREHAALVSTRVAIGRRVAWRRGLAALGAPGGLVESALAALPPDELAPTPEDAIAAAAPRLPARLGAALPWLERLARLPSHLATHPGGVVVTAEPLAALAPLERAPSGALVTQLDLEGCADLGLVKLDLLGNHALDQIERALHVARGEPAQRARPGAAPGAADAPAAELPARFDPTWIPPLDEPLRGLLARAATVGCFQLESPAMRALLAELPVRGFDDCVAALAAIRPGAAAGEAKGRFLRRARGEEPVRFDAPVLRSVLGATHGVPLFEEDVVRMLAAAGAMELAQAEGLRAAIVAAGADRRVLARLRADFVGRARDPTAARVVWRLAERFAAYSFSRAHAASHASIAWQIAWLKAHRPRALGCALLDDYHGHYPLRVLAAELQRAGMVLLPPRVAASEARSLPAPGAGPRSILLGLELVEPLSRATLARILAGRPFRDLADFLARAKPGRRELVALVRAGACDGLAPLERARSPFVHDALVAALATGVGPQRLAALDALATPVPVDAQDARRLERWRALRRARDELSAMGLAASAHPLAILRGEARRAGCLELAEAAARPGERVRVACLLAAARRPTAGLRYLTLEDEGALLEARLCGAAYRRHDRALTTPGPYLVEGRVHARGAAPRLEIELVMPFHERGGAPSPSARAPRRDQPRPPAL